MSLPVDKRYEIVFLSHHPMGPQLGVKAVAKAVKCAKSTVQYWLKRWKDSKDLSDSKRSGRPRGTTKKVDQRIVDLASSDNIVTTRDIQHALKRENKEVSQETIRRRLKEPGAKFSAPLSKPLLTEKHRQNRLRWAEATRDIDWNRVIFSGETTVRLNQLKRFVWNLPGRRKVVRTVKYPIKVNVWGCFSSNGFGRVYCFRENLKADLLCTIYKRCLLPTARDHFGPNSADWKLVEDNDPKHMSQLANEWRSKHGVRRLDWPSMSPDLNPIENVWKLLKVNLGKKHLRTYKSLVSAIKKEWKAFPMDLTTNLVRSMKNRISDVIVSKGDFIMY
jgi:transposase